MNKFQYHVVRILLATALGQNLIYHLQVKMEGVTDVFDSETLSRAEKEINTMHWRDQKASDDFTQSQPLITPQTQPQEVWSSSISMPRPAEHAPKTYPLAELESPAVSIFSLKPMRSI